MSVSETELERVPAAKLPEDLQIARLIFAAEENKHPVSFDQLVTMANSTGVGDKLMVSRALDKLFDQGLVRTKWINRDGRNLKIILIAGEAEDLVRAVAEHTE